MPPDYTMKTRRRKPKPRPKPKTAPSIAASRTGPVPKAPSAPAPRVGVSDASTQGGSYGKKRAKPAAKRQAAKARQQKRYRGTIAAGRTGPLPSATPPPRAKAPATRKTDPAWARRLRGQDPAKAQRRAERRNPSKLTAAQRREQAREDRARAERLEREGRASARAAAARGAARSRRMDEIERRGTPATPGNAAKVAGLGGIEGAKLLYEVPAQTGRAFAEDPVGTSKATARQARDAALGFPGAIASTVKDTVEGTADGDPLRGVKRSVSAYAKDAARRYGPLLDPNEKDGGRKFRERVKKEGGLAEALDAVAVVAPAAKVGGRAFSNTAKSGALGEERRRVASEPRMRERTSGGPAREQPVHPNYIKVKRAKKKDTRAFRGQQRVVREADARAGRREDAPDGAKGAVDAVVREATERGEVVPSKVARPKVAKDARGRRRVQMERPPSARKLKRAQQREGYARPKGRTLIAMKREQGEEIARGSQRQLAGLNRKEVRAFKVAMQLGITRRTSVEDAVAALRERRAQIVANRKRLGKDPRVVDEVKVLDRILADPAGHLTAKLAQTVEVERARGARVAGTDPGVGPERAAQRRAAPQAAALGVERRGTPIRDAERDARQAVRQAKRSRASAGSRRRVAERQAAREQGRAEVIVARSEPVRAEQLARAERAVALHTRAAANHRRRAESAATPAARADAKAKAAAAQRRAVAAQERIDALRAGRRGQPNRTLAKVGRTQAKLHDAQLRERAAQDRVTTAKGERAELAARRARGDRLVDAEPVQDFLRRVDEVAASRGLDAPGYFPSIKRNRSLFSAFAVGGSTAAKADRAYEGKLYATGEESNAPEGYHQALAKNIKRKHNWNLVGRTFGAHTFAWGRNKTIAELEDELTRRGIDHDSVAFWNPERFMISREIYEREGAPLDESSGGLEVGDQALDAAVQAATADRLQLSTRGEDFKQTTGWSVVPRHLHDEVHADTRPSGKIGRGFDIFKGFQSRLLLGTSPAWLAFQVVSNGLLSGMGGANPLDFAAAMRWWKKLSDEEKAAIEPYIGVGHFHDSIEQTKMGAASNAKVLNAYRAFKASAFWHRKRRVPGTGRAVAVRDFNPLDVLFRVDERQNNYFRRVVFYSKAKREAYARMGENASSMQRLHDRLVPAILGGRSPEKQMREFARSQQELERLAEHVNDFLGDYLTYTASERRTIGRAAMFYGYLRFSLRFTFYTMPTQHPALTAIAAQLGQLQTQELRALLGGTELPWMMGRFIYASDGELKSIDLSRANPFMNQVTQIRLPQGNLFSVTREVLKMAPPVVVALADQAYGTSSFKGRQFRVEGETTGRKVDEYGLENSSRIFFEDMAGLIGYYRIASKATASGDPEGDDSSLLLGRRYTKYKRPDILWSINEDKKLRPTSVWQRALLETMPLIPRRDNSPEVAARMRRIEQQNGGSAAVPTTMDPLMRARVEAAQAAAAAQGPAAAELMRARVAAAQAAAAAARPAGP